MSGVEVALLCYVKPFVYLISKTFRSSVCCSHVEPGTDEKPGLLEQLAELEKVPGL